MTTETTPTSTSGAPAKAPQPKNQKILILLPAEVYKPLSKQLEARLQEQAVLAKIDRMPLTEADRTNYQWILQLPWRLQKEEELKLENVFQRLLRVPGSVKLQSDKLPAAEEPELESMLARYWELEELVQAREQDVAFQKLVRGDRKLQFKKNKQAELKQKLAKLDHTMDKTEKPYYLAISYIFATAIERLTGVRLLDKIMKGLVRIMIVDDIGERTPMGLSALHYNRKYLSHMRTSELLAKFREFKRQHAEDDEGKLNLQQFFFHCEEFQKIDIVFLNSWEFAADNLYVRIGLRKKTILSKKDQRQANKSPEQIAKEKTETEARIAANNRKLQTVEEVIAQMESIPNLEASEQEVKRYQNQLRKRKKVIGDIKRDELKLKVLDKPIQKEDAQVFYKFDLFEVFKSKQSFMDRFGERVATWGIDMIQRHFQVEDQHSFTNLQAMAEASKQWSKLDGELQKQNLQVEQLTEQILAFAEQHGMLEKESYTPTLHAHLLDKLEMAALACEIVNFYERIRRQKKASEPMGFSF